MFRKYGGRWKTEEGLGMVNIHCIYNSQRTNETVIFRKANMAMYACNLSIKRMEI